MNCKLIDLTEDAATILYENQQRQGAVVEFEIQLPEDILLDSFVISGVVTKCEYVRNNGSSGYLTQMTIGDLTAENKKILRAYIEFQKQEKELDKIQIDYQAIQDAIQKFGENFLKIVSIAEKLNQKSLKKITYH